MQVEEVNATSGWFCYLQKPQKCKVPQRATNLKLAKSSKSKTGAGGNLDQMLAATNIKQRATRGKNMGNLVACSRLERVIATSVSTFPKGKSNTCPAFLSKVFFNKQFSSFLPTYVLRSLLQNYSANEFSYISDLVTNYVFYFYICPSFIIEEF